MKKFLKRVSIFLLPVLLFVLPPAYLLWKTGEHFITPDALLTSEKKFLIGYAYNDRNYEYLKWKALVDNKRFHIWALGSSRALEFRKEMFSQSFYNAGYSVSRLRQFRPFLEAVPREKYPDFLIIPLDQWLFNKNYDDFSQTVDKNKWSAAFRKNANFPVLKNVWNDIFDGKYDLFLTVPENHIGLNAVVNNKGIRNDGSFTYGSQTAALLPGSYADQHKFDETIDRIENRAQQFRYGNRVNPRAIDEVWNLFEFCKKNNIHVIAYLPPFPDRVYNQMVRSGNYEYLKSIYDEVLPVSKKYGFEVYDFSTASSVGSNDGEMIDGFHGGEMTYLKMLLKMLDSGSKLNAVSSAEKLRRDAKHSVSAYEVYP